MDAITFWTIAGGVTTVALAIVTVGWKVGGSIKGAIGAVETRLSAKIDAVDFKGEARAQRQEAAAKEFHDFRVLAAERYADRHELQSLRTEVQEGFAELREGFTRIGEKIARIPKAPPRTAAKPGAHARR